MYKTITHNNYTAEITWRDTKVKISSLSNIQWTGNQEVTKIIEEYSTFLAKVAEESKKFEIECLAAELEVILEHRAALYGV